MIISVFTNHILTLLKAVTSVIAVVFITTAFSLPAHADSLSISATVPAPLPTSPAVITSHYDQEHVTNANITLDGTCGDGTYVTLDNNGMSQGAASCISGSFTIQITLYSSADLLQAHVFNSTDNEGPVGPSLTLYLDILPQEFPFSAIIPQTSSPQPGIASKSQLSLRYTYSFKLYHIGESWQGNLSVEGGTSPYIITVDWQDGSHSKQTVDPGSFSLTHTYLHPGSFQPFIQATDAYGATTSVQALVVVESNQTPVRQAETTSAAAPVLLGAGIIVTIAIVAELFGATQFIRFGRLKK